MRSFSAKQFANVYAWYAPFPTTPQAIDFFQSRCVRGMQEKAALSIARGLKLNKSLTFLQVGFFLRYHLLVFICTDWQ